MEKLLEILKSINPDVDYLNEKKLMDDGLLDSLGIVDLISRIDEEFEVFIDPDYITPEYFNSIQDIYQLIEDNKNGNK